ncbi:glucose-regulated protein [Apiospora arundinis]
MSAPYSQQGCVSHSCDEYGPAVAIDIGDTYARVGYFNLSASEFVIFKDDYGETSIPTCVAFTGSEILVGRDALQYAHTNPEQTICRVGRFLDSYWSSPEDQATLSDLPYQTVEGPQDTVAVQVTIAGQTQTYTTSELLGLLMARLKNLAEENLGQEVKDAVIAVPANFNPDTRRGPSPSPDGHLNGSSYQYMRQAAALAGLYLQRIVRDPISAAVAYGVDKSSSEVQNIVVFDMGGEKLQISVMEVDEDVFEMLGTVSLPIGGRHFNKPVADRLLKQFKKRNDIQTTEITADSMRRLDEEVEMAKRNLSTRMVTRVEIPGFHGHLALNETVTRAKFEELNMNLFQSALKPLKPLLDDANFTIADIDHVFFSGGSSHIPKLRFLLEEFFAGKKLPTMYTDDNVIVGTAVQAALFYDEPAMGCPVEVHPLSIGIETAGKGYSLPVIRSNTIVPTRKSISVKASGLGNLIKITHGERLYAKDNRFLGVLDVSNISDEAETLLLSMDLDANGILDVKVENRETKKQVRTVLTEASDNARDIGLIESMQQDGDEHWDIERPQMDKYKALVDLSSFAEAVEHVVWAKLLLPEASRGKDAPMMQVLAAANSASRYAAQDDTAHYTLEKIADKKLGLEKIVRELLVEDLSSIHYQPIYLVGTLSEEVEGYNEGHDEL